MFALQLLGTPALDGKPLERKAAALLALLALSGETSRARLAAWLWGEAAGGRNNLRQLLFKLPRGLLGGAEVLRLAENVRTDVKHAPLPDGDLLGLFEYADCPEFADWLFEARANLREARLIELAALADALGARGDLETALGYAQRLLLADPYSEVHHRRVMALHLARHDRAAAMRAFDACAAMLRQEFGLEPEAETLSLLREARRGGAPGLAPDLLAVLRAIAALGSAYTPALAAAALETDEANLAALEERLEATLGSDPRALPSEQLAATLSETPAAARRALHRRLAQALEARGARAATLAEQQLAAGLEAEAVESLKAAFREARSEYRLGEALGLALRAASVLERLGERAAAFAVLHETLGCASGGAAAQQERLVASLRALALEPDEHARASLAEMAWRIRLGQLEAAADAVRRARSAARLGPEPGMEAEVLAAHGEQLVQSGFHREALEPLLAAQTLAERGGHLSALFSALIVQAKALNRLGQHSEAVQVSRRALETASAAGNRGWRGHAVNDLAAHLIAAGEAQEARDLLEWLESGLRRAPGGEAYLAIALTNLVRACAALGDDEAVSRYAVAARALAEQLGQGNRARLERTLAEALRG